MTQDKSILLTLEEQGVPAPRVRLKGTERSENATARYEIVGEIARGGVGVVHRGRDNDIGRDVALKVLRDKHLGSPELVRRFVEEAQIGGQLQHPGIVPVYELGLQADNRPYFAMKLVKGETLAARLDARQGPSDGGRALLAVFRDVCRTLAYAHSRGVIHRDLKPSNIMIGSFAEVQVVDWGFAKVLRKGGVADEGLAGKRARDRTMISTVRSGAGNASIAGSVMGTPAYMPPEQALGRVEDLDERSDVFSLGAILCEILTGEPPYEGSDEDRITAAAQGRLEAAYVRLSACDADAPLVELCRQCLASMPKDRPASAQVLADTVAAYLTSAEGRAHRARMRAVKAEAKADEQRRARRQTILVGSAVLATAVIAVSAYFLVDADRTRRANERQVAIETALQDAGRLRAAEDWPEALAAAKRALSLAGDDARGRDEVRHLHAGIEAEAAAAERAASRARAETELLAFLDEIAMNRGDRLDHARTDAEYAKALPDLAALAACDRKAELAAHLDLWTWLRREYVQDRDWRPLDAAARKLDPDPLRNRIRTAAAAEEVIALRTLAAEIDVASTNVRSLDLLGVVLDEAGDADAAAALLRRVFHHHPGDFWIHFHLAHCSPPEESAAHCIAAIALRPASAVAYSDLGIALRKTGELDDAIAAGRESIRLDPSNARAHNNLGVALYDQGDDDGALESYREALRLDPGLAMTHANLGTLLWRKHDFEAAIEAFEISLRLDSESRSAANTHVGLGAALMSAGRLEDALVTLAEAVRLDPKSANAHLHLGIALRGNARIEEAEKSLREALRLDPDSSNGHFQLGLIHQTRGERDEAIAAFRLAARLDPSNTIAHVALGAALHRKGRLDEAISEIRKVVRLVPDQPWPRNNLGTLLMRKGNVKAAREQYREAIRIDPEYALAHMNLGELHLRAYDLSAAADALRTALRLDPALAKAQLLLGIVLGWRGEFAEALEHLSQTAQLQAPSAALQLELERARRMVPAHERLAAVLRGGDTPEHAEEWLGLAEVTHRLEDPAAAVRFYERAFLADPGLMRVQPDGHLYNAAELWRDQVASDPGTVMAKMLYWRRDPDLVSIRDAEDLSDAFLKLWIDVDALLKRAQGARK